MGTTLREFCKETKEELKGKRIILCEHLKNKSIDLVEVNLFLGDNTRALLCPVCYKIHAQTIWERMIRSVLFLVDTLKQVEYKQWLETSGKEK